MKRIFLSLLTLCFVLATLACCMALASESETKDIQQEEGIKTAASDSNDSTSNDDGNTDASALSGDGNADASMLAGDDVNTDTSDLNEDDNEDNSPAETGITIRDLTYGFSDQADVFGYSDYPLEPYKMMYGNTLLAERIYKRASQKWIGNNYGMVCTSSLFSESENGILISSFCGGESANLSDLTLNMEGYPYAGDTSLTISLQKFIEVMQASQGGENFSRAFAANQDRLSEIYRAVETFQKTGKGAPAICIWSDGWCHALLGYRVEETDTESRIYVYDPDLPKDGERYLVLKKDTSGSYNAWSYKGDALRTYNNKGDAAIGWSGENAHLTYIPYAVFSSDWSNCGKPSDNMILLTLDIANAEIYDVEDEIVATFTDGIMQTSRDDVIRAFDWVVAPDGTHEVSVWLPVNNVYTIRNSDTSKTSFEAILVNIRQGVTITTKAGAVSLSVEDKTSSVFAQIMEPGKDYQIEIASVSDLNPDFEKVALKGTTRNGAVLSVSLYGGFLSLDGAEGLKTLRINDQEASPAQYGGSDIGKGEAILHFTDVSEDLYYYQPIQWAVKRGITKGTTSTTFSPDEVCSRAHILTFLWRAFGSPNSDVEYQFSDVDESYYYAAAARWAYENGLISGEFFEGVTPCSRAEAVGYLWKLSGSPDTGESPFEDVIAGSEISKATAWAVAQGITKGKTEQRFEPYEICTRGQIVTFLYRHFEQADV